MKVSPTIQKEIHFHFKDQDFIIDPLKALYWSQKETLIVSDLHLGKAGHFRKNGIPVPRQTHISDIQKLDLLISKYHPATLVFLGDLFHSDLNDEWGDFIHWSALHSSVRQILVKGNHDILSSEAYSQICIEILDDWKIEPFHFSHEPTVSRLYNISGHIHPGIRLYGHARQAVTLSCFYFSVSNALLPAFGNFTGNYRIRAVRGDRIFAIADESVIELIG